MKRVVVLVLVIGLAIGCGAWAAEETAHFRNTTWGMTLDEVKETEPESKFRDLQLSNRSMIPLVTVAKKFDAMAVFHFDEKGKLYMGHYGFTYPHTNETDYIDDYYTLQGLLTNKYGTPILDSVDWKNDLFKDNPEDYGSALLAGDLEYTTLYEVGDTSICLSLKCDEYGINFKLAYEDLKHEEVDDSGL